MRLCTSTVAPKVATEDEAVIDVDGDAGGSGFAFQVDEPEEEAGFYFLSEVHSRAEARRAGR